MKKVDFGTSAYQRVICLSERRKRSELAKRLTPSSGGYDFHRAAKQIATQYAAGIIDPTDALAQIAGIKKDAERKSAAEAVNALASWLGDQTASASNLSLARFQSPNDFFTVKFDADISIKSTSGEIPVHLWNTKSVDLTARQALAVLGLFDNEEEIFTGGILDLRKRKLFTIEDRQTARALSQGFAQNVERILIEEAGYDPSQYGYGKRGTGTS